MLVNKGDFEVDIVEWDMEIVQQDRRIGMDFGVIIAGEDIIAKAWGVLRWRIWNFVLLGDDGMLLLRLVGGSLLLLGNDRGLLLCEEVLLL